MFRAVFVFSGILPLPQPSPVLLRRRLQNSGVPAAVKGWTIAKDSLPSLELPLQDSNRNTSTTIGKLSRRRSQPRKNHRHRKSDAPPRADQSSCPPSRHVTRSTRLAHSCDATSALDAVSPTPRHVSPNATSATVDHCWLPRHPLTVDFWALTFCNPGVSYSVFRPDSIFAVCFCIFCL